MYLVELIQNYFSDFKTHASKEHEIMLDCPFCIDNGHSHDTEKRLGINTLAEKAHCHRCNWRGGGRNLYYALADTVNVVDEYETDNERVELVAKPKTTKFSLKKISLPAEYEPLWHDDLDSLGRKALRYLTDRGFSIESIKQHRLGFCGAGKYTHRIIIPVYYKKHVVGFTGRTFANAEPKYLNSDGEKFLFNYPRKIRKEKCLLLEGFFDAANVFRYCHRDYDCIGLAGSALTDLQLKVLGRYSEIVVWNDPDQPGVEGAIKVIKTLKENTPAKLFGVSPDHTLVAEGRDPGDMTKNEIRAALSRIKPWTASLENRLLVSVLF